MVIGAHDSMITIKNGDNANSIKLDLPITLRVRLVVLCYINFAAGADLTHDCMRLETGLTIRILRYLSNIYEDIPN